MEIYFSQVYILNMKFIGVHMSDDYNQEKEKLKNEWKAMPMRLVRNILLVFVVIYILYLLGVLK